MPQEVQGTQIPRCVGFILDGNRRWAKQHGLQTKSGHMIGYDKMKEALLWVREKKIQYAVVYGLSTENLGRDKHEVENLFEIMRFVLSPSEVSFFKSHGLRLRFMGALENLPQDIQNRMAEVEEETFGGEELSVALAVAYGGRADVLQAVKRIVRFVPREVVEQYTESEFSRFLWTGAFCGRETTPDPDLVVRTGGRNRLSGFLSWQCAYSELYFSDTLWPDFSKEEFLKILGWYSSCMRNFGK